MEPHSTDDGFSFFLGPCAVALSNGHRTKSSCLVKCVCVCVFVCVFV